MDRFKKWNYSNSMTYSINFNSKSHESPPDFEMITRGEDEERERKEVHCYQGTDDDGQK